jgi:hypothetical protein
MRCPVCEPRIWILSARGLRRSEHERRDGGEHRRLRGAGMTAIPGARGEGIWRDCFAAPSELPWPEPAPDWDGRAAFVEALDRVGLAAEGIAAAGFSRCRLCRSPNGTVEFILDGWAWPSGFRHYVTEHDTQPTEEFEAFILTRGGTTVAAEEAVAPK